MNTTPVILIVDDDEMHLIVARRAIARLQLCAEVLTVTSGTDALRLLGLGGLGSDASTDAGTDAARVAVVMLDIGLPDVSGWHVLERIRGSEYLRSVPVVLVTSSDRPEDVSQAYDLGANSYLVKRHEPGGPGNYLARAARYWIELNQGSKAAS